MTDTTLNQPTIGEVNPAITRLTEDDLHWFNEGTHYRLYEKLGSHPMTVDGIVGTYFAVWAPNAERVAVMGSFNHWDRGRHALCARGHSGIWEGFIPGVGKGDHYKYHIVSRNNGHTQEKADPFAIFAETPHKTASIVWDLNYEWGDADWMKKRATQNPAKMPISTYEVHLGSWRRVPEEGNRSLSYREMAHQLAEHVKNMGFTHVELMPVMEHPFFASWGYQVTGYFAPSSRYGQPQDFMYLIDHLHKEGIGVYLDWVPSHFPTDSHGLGLFDGTHLYEHADPRKGFHPDWSSLIFNYGRNEVKNFLISNALFWLNVYHADGLRVDAVASMLYLDYSRKDGEWLPNPYGGKENIEAIDFLRRVNEEVYKAQPGIHTIAEESTSWGMVSRPTYVGGLGFGMKWDMGWMHDTCRYMAKDPIHRVYHHHDLTFRMLYAYHENFVLSLSHDEVVHGKGSLLGKMPGDAWQKFANLRLLYGYMFAGAGKKLIFMGGEFGQGPEWNHDTGLSWEQTHIPSHQGVLQWFADLNRAYRTIPALHERDWDPAGFEWIDCNDAQQSVMSLLRRGESPAEMVLCAFNFTPIPRVHYDLGVPEDGFWKEILNSDAQEYGGSGMGNLGGVLSRPEPIHGRPHRISVTLPPLGAVFFRLATGEKA